jgi:hypothetical protein
MQDADDPVEPDPDEPADAPRENPYLRSWEDFTHAAELERELYRKLVEQVRPSYDKVSPSEFERLTAEWQEKIKGNESLRKRLAHIASLTKRARVHLEPAFARPHVEQVIEAFAEIERQRKEMAEAALDDFGSPIRRPHGPTYFALVDGFFGRGAIKFFERVYRPFAKNPYHKPGQAEAEYGLAMAHFHHGGKDKTVRTMLSSATTKHPIATAQMMVREGDYQREVGMTSKKAKEVVHARKAINAYVEGLAETQTAAAAIEGIESVIREAAAPDTRQWLAREYPPDVRLQLADAAIDVDPCTTSLLRAKAEILDEKGDERGAEFHRCAAKLIDWVARALRRLEASE